MEHFHVYKHLPEYGNGVMGGLSLWDLKDLFDSLGKSFYWYNENGTEGEISRENVEYVIKALNNAFRPVNLPQTIIDKGYHANEIVKALEMFLDEGDPNSNHIAFSIF